MIGWGFAAHGAYQATKMVACVVPYHVLYSKIKDMIYSAKCIFKFDRIKNEVGESAFEERIVLLHASSFDEAIYIAEEDAKKYAAEENGEYLNFVAAYQVVYGDVVFGGVQEIYSIMRYDDLSDEDFVTLYYDNGGECTKRT